VEDDPIILVVVGYEEKGRVDVVPFEEVVADPVPETEREVVVGKLFPLVEDPVPEECEWE
jgi:hypothetical protein